MEIISVKDVSCFAPYSQGQLPCSSFSIDESFGNFQNYVSTFDKGKGKRPNKKLSQEPIWNLVLGVKQLHFTTLEAVIVLHVNPEFKWYEPSSSPIAKLMFLVKGYENHREFFCEIFIPLESYTPEEWRELIFKELKEKASSLDNLLLRLGKIMSNIQTSQSELSG